MSPLFFKQMKAIVRIVTAEREFNQDQKNIMKRIVCVLIEHNLSVSLTIGRRINKEGKIFKLRAV